VADCLYHGYSGGPGICEDCRKEDLAGSKRGTIPYDPAEHLTLEELNRKTENEIKNSRKSLR